MNHPVFDVLDGAHWRTVFKMLVDMISRKLFATTSSEV